MCIIAVKPANVKLRKDYMQNCYNVNGNGCGFAVIDNGKVIVFKGVMKFEDFWNVLDAAQQTHIKSPMLIHFRIATSGEVDDLNCHPFQIDEKHALVHNGTLYDFTSKTSKVSDTYLFVDNIIKPMFERDKELYKQKFQRYIIEECIGHRNKIAILSVDGEYVIYNESAGEWADSIDGKVWYSKKDYLPPPPPKPKKDKNKNRRGEKSQESKPTAYKMNGGNRPLTAREINDLTHKHHCKLKPLLQRKVVEPYSFTEVPPTKGTPGYSEYWKKYGVTVC